VKIRPVRAELLHADERTDTMKLTVVFGHFAKAPKNWEDKISKKKDILNNRKKQ
jgi:hypothetical protein